jgi:hypothetical protein
MITARNPMPIRDVTRVRTVMLHGFRDLGRRPAVLGSAVFTISSAPSPRFLVATGFLIAPMSRGGTDGEWMLDARADFSIDPLRACEGFQLKLPDRRLLAEEGLELSGLLLFGRGSSFLGACWLFVGTGDRWCSSRSWSEVT